MVIADAHRPVERVLAAQKVAAIVVVIAGAHHPAERAEPLVTSGRGCPPRKLAGVVIDRADVERNCDSRPARNKIDRQGAGRVLHPRVNCAARENNSVRCHLKTRRTVLEPEHALERSCGEVRVGREEGGGGGFRSMVERAIGVEEDGVFRNIVAFL